MPTLCICSTIDARWFPPAPHTGPATPTDRPFALVARGTKLASPSFDRIVRLWNTHTPPGGPSRWSPERC